MQIGQKYENIDSGKRYVVKLDFESCTKSKILEADRRPASINFDSLVGGVNPYLIKFAHARPRQKIVKVQS